MKRSASPEKLRVTAGEGKETMPRFTGCKRQFQSRPAKPKRPKSARLLA